MKQFYTFLSLKTKGKKTLRSITLGLGLLLGLQNVANAQVSTYTFAQSAGTFTPITGTVLGAATANTTTANLNSNVFPVTLPFNFVFNGTSYGSLNVSTNGFVSFGATAPGTTVTSPLSSATNTAYDGAISAFGRDISSFFDVNGITGNISWETLGTAPNREVVIQWRNFRPNSSTSATTVYSFSFQIRLHETSNVIDMVYDAGSYLVGSSNVSGTVQVGLRGSSNADFINRLNSTTLEFINSTQGTANSSSQSFHTNNTTPGMPSAGLTYTWTPPSCWAAQNLALVSSAPDSANISWAAPSIPPAGYDVYYSTSNTSPTSSTQPTNSNLSGTTAVLSPLSPATTYYVWIRSNCGSGNTSIWSATPLTFTSACQPPVISATSGATVCPGSTATLSATVDSGVTLTWYDASTGGNAVGTGATFTTPTLSTTTPYYVSASNGTSMFVGPVNPNSLTAGSATTASTTYYIQFEVTNQPITLVSTDVFPNAAGQSSEIEILQGPSTFSVINTVNFTSNIASDGTTAQTVPINMLLTPGTYRMRLSGGSYYRNYQSNAVFPYSIPNFSITTGSNISSDSYYFLYNLKVNTGCESARTMVTATVDAAACLSTSEVNGKDNIKVYPNPFSDYINISKPELVKSIRISDVSGKLIRNINQPESVLRLQDLSQGMYILQLDMKDGSKQSVKIIKK